MFSWKNVYATLNLVTNDKFICYLKYDISLTAANEENPFER